ncbi:MAG: sulfate adenylyltransferase subunit CysN [Flavobacteriales bacterium]
MINQDREILRFTTAGSVDDGKSTLIGRLLYDSKSIFEDQLDAVESSSKKRGLENMDLALLTDGLKDEREQGITIDVAYRYFSTPKRKFIIADTPGHIQYTRNMVTGASTANLALILVDARKGVIEQTKRHSYIASLLQIPHLVVCVNKMDLVEYSEEVFENIVQQFEDFSALLDVKDIRFIPISALKGDNVVEKSEKMVWYKGNPLLETLETIYITGDQDFEDVRFPIQTVIRPKSEAFHDYRGYAGRMSGGVLKKGEEVILLPSGFKSKIKSIDTYKGEVEVAFPPMSVSIQLEDDIDLGRGDMIVKDDHLPNCTQDLDVMLCWLNNESPVPRGKYYLKHTSNEVKAMIKNIVYKVDINTLDRKTEDKEIKMNDIVRVKLRTTKTLITDSYSRNRITGSLILIDATTNETVAAGMIV